MRQFSNGRQSIRLRGRAKRLSAWACWKIVAMTITGSYGWEPGSQLHFWNAKRPLPIWWLALRSSERSNACCQGLTLAVSGTKSLIKNQECTFMFIDQTSLWLTLVKVSSFQGTKREEVVARWSWHLAECGICIVAKVFQLHVSWHGFISETSVQVHYFALWLWQSRSPAAKAIETYTALAAGDLPICMRGL